MGGGGSSGVDGDRMGGVWLNTLAWTVWVLARSGISHNTVEVNGVKSGASAPSFGTYMKGGLANPTPVWWWTGFQLVPPPGA